MMMPVILLKKHIHITITPKKFLPSTHMIHSIDYQQQVTHHLKEPIYTMETEEEFKKKF